MSNSEVLRRLLDNVETSESEIWDSIARFNEEDAMSFALVDSLLDHPNCSDRIVAKYFSNDVPIDEDTWEDRGDRLIDQFFWWDVEEVLPRPYISLRTRTLIAQQIVRTLAQLITEMKDTNGDSLQSLVYFDLELPDGLVVLPDPNEQESIRQEYLKTLSELREIVQQLGTAISHSENHQEDAEDIGSFDDVVEALSNWNPAIMNVLETSGHKS